MLEAELGPGIAEALARTAEQLREDAEAFDEMIDETIEDIVEHAEAGISVSVAALAANPAALRQRIIRHVVAGEFGASLTRAQTLEVARLVTDWPGQGPIDLPGCRARRVGGRARRFLEFSAASHPPALTLPVQRPTSRRRTLAGQTDPGRPSPPRLPYLCPSFAIRESARGSAQEAMKRRGVGQRDRTVAGGVGGTAAIGSARSARARMPGASRQAIFARLHAELRGDVIDRECLENLVQSSHHEPLVVAGIVARCRQPRLSLMRAADVQSELTQVLVTEEQIHAKLDEIAAQVGPTTRARTCCSSAC